MLTTKDRYSIMVLYAFLHINQIDKIVLLEIIHYTCID